MIQFQMSVVTDSPVHSSSSDDFVAFLDSALDASSPGSLSDDKDVEKQDELESPRCSALFFHFSMHPKLFKEF